MELGKIRAEIDAIDKKIVELYEKRLSLCDEVAKAKKSTDKAVRDSGREKAIIDSLTDGKSQENAKAISGLYTTVFEISRQRQTGRLLRISKPFEKFTDENIGTADFENAESAVCAGKKGAYAEIACRRIMPNANISYTDSFDEVFKSVESGICQYGIVPIENSNYGSVDEVFDALLDFSGCVTGSVKLSVNHMLCAKKGVKLSDITEVISHRQAIGQCKSFFKSNPNIKSSERSNTAFAAAEAAVSDRRDLGVICSFEAAKLYGLDIIKDDISSDKNFTVFYIIAKNPELSKNINKASFVFKTDNTPGALCSVLSKFRIDGINLTKIESRPSVGSDFEFLFFCEADIANISDSTLSFFSNLSEELEYFKFFGFYDEISG